MAKMGPGYALWVTTVSKAIKNMDDIDMVMDAFDAVDNLSNDDYYKKHFYARYDRAVSLALQEPLMGQSPLKKSPISRRYSLHSKRYLIRFQYLHRWPSPFSFPQILRKKL